MLKKKCISSQEGLRQLGETCRIAPTVGLRNDSLFLIKTLVKSISCGFVVVVVYPFSIVQYVFLKIRALCPGYHLCFVY